MDAEEESVNTTCDSQGPELATPCRVDEGLGQVRIGPDKDVEHSL
jgi:hypothetical protein